MWGHVGSNDKGNEDVDGGDSESKIDGGDNVGSDSSASMVMVLLMVVLSVLMVLMMPIMMMVRV